MLEQGADNSKIIILIPMEQTLMVAGGNGSACALLQTR